jgi:hypothetical protein
MVCTRRMLDNRPLEKILRITYSVIDSSVK